MNTNDFAVELFYDWAWRSEEIQLLRTAGSAQPTEELRDTFRRSMVVILYAHFEGFCVFALSHYLTVINRQKLRCGEAATAILAASWEALFQAMETGDEKCKVFHRSLPDDKNLHRHWRRRHFVEELHQFQNRVVALPDDLVDAESNLKPWTLKRNLFLLGLDHEFVDEHADSINRLLRRRNDIAHGDERRGIPEAEYDEYELMVLRIKDRLVDFLVKAFREARYSRDPVYAI